MIMELCEGTYADRMNSNPLTAEEARYVGSRIADALADAHTLGVLHRDVNPQTSSSPGSVSRHWPTSGWPC